MKLDVAETGIRLAPAARYVAKTPLDHFPRQVIYQFMQGSSALVAEGLAAELAAGFNPVVESVSMPRRGFGPRPVGVLSGASRVLYTALVDKLMPALPAPTRGAGKYAALQEFGTEGDHKYVVDLDFASCYEFIDHDILFNELILRSMDFATASGLREFLLAVSSGRRGLPQMQDASDRLADTYLSLIDRNLARDGYDTLRYADDIRIRVDGWEDANRVIEEVAEHARSLGLILSAQKTSIRKRDTLVDTEEHEADFFSKYLDKAYDSLAMPFAVGVGPYGEIDVEMVPPEDKDALQEASLRLLKDLSKRLADDELDKLQGINRFIAPSLMRMVDAAEGLTGEELADVAFYAPQRLEEAVTYIVQRSRESIGVNENHIERLASLTGMGRQSPWAKLHMLSAAGDLLAESEGPDAQVVLEWTQDQLSDRHETVRVEAALVLARNRKFKLSALKDLWNSASSLSYPGIAASVAVQLSDAVSASQSADGAVGPSKGGQLSQLSAVQGVDYLTKVGVDWASPSDPKN